VLKTQLKIPLSIRFAQPIVCWHSVALAADAAALQATLRASRYRVSGSGGANRIGRKIPIREGRVERFRTRFAGFGGFAPAALEQVIRPEQLIHNDLEEMPKHPWWKGRVLLIGDAAHATTPNMGQGAAMALEDVGVLCEMLGTGETWANLLPAFVARREPRVRFIVDQSRRIGRVGQLENILLASLRNWMTRAVPQRLAEGGVRRAAEAEV
jgi:2-polyprenyl-6-methoxyphenol hydroxylase-like FAD-dependent oxidoreductase